MILWGDTVCNWYCVLVLWTLNLCIVGDADIVRMDAGSGKVIQTVHINQKIRKLLAIGSRSGVISYCYPKQVLRWEHGSGTFRRDYDRQKGKPTGWVLMFHAGRALSKFICILYVCSMNLKKKSGLGTIASRYYSISFPFPFLREFKGTPTE